MDFIIREVPSSSVFLLPINFVLYRFLLVGFSLKKSSKVVTSVVVIESMGWLRIQSVIDDHTRHILESCGISLSLVSLAEFR